MAYCKTDQLRLGNIPLPANGSAERAVNQAADEIDAALGFKYVVPIRATGATERPVATLISNINIYLATGRLIEELTAAREDAQIHAYALGLVNEAHMALRSILNGEIILEGVEVVTTGDPATGGPVLYNKDETSNVEDFYDNISNPIAVGDAVWPLYLRGYPTGSAVYRG